MKARISILTLLVVILSHLAMSQNKADSIKMVKYDITYTFKDGILLEFDDLMKNNPVPFSQTNLPDPEKLNSESNWFMKEEFKYFNKYGIRQTVPSESIWGLSYDDKLYVNWSGKLHLVPYIGNISHFVAKVQVMQNRSADTFYDPYYVYSGPSSFISTEVVQMLINMQNGKVMRFIPENVSRLISDEKEIYEEYQGLRKKKKEKMKFYYIRKYNEKNPLYLSAE